MKVLMTWEMGSSLDHLHHLRLLAYQLRARHENVSIILATSQSFTDVDMNWTDKILVSQRIRINIPSLSEGIISDLHQLGWTAPDLRQYAFSNWAQLYRKLNPDLVICEAAPGALLSAVLENIQCIATGHDRSLVSVEDMKPDDAYPEFTQWLWHLTGRSHGELMNKPGISFCPYSTDRKRAGLVMNANPAQWPWEQVQDASFEAVIIGNCSFAPLQQVLAEHGIESIKPNSLAGLNLTSTRLVIGNYDRLGVCLACAAPKAIYLGTEPSTNLQNWAEACKTSRIAHHFGSPEDLALILSTLQRKDFVKKAEFVDLDTILSYFKL